MSGMATSNGRDAWLKSLLGAFDSSARRSDPVSPAVLAEVERHLRDNARGMAVGSLLIH